MSVYLGLSREADIHTVWEEIYDEKLDRSRRPLQATLGSLDFILKAYRVM